MNFDGDHVNHNGINFLKIKSGITTVGTSKGGWVYASNRPMHEVKNPDFFIMESVFTIELLKRILPSYESLESGEEFTGIDRKLISDLLTVLNSNIPEGYEIRAPSIGEWKQAHDTKSLRYTSNVEVLSDSAFSNFRGAHMDGSPRIEGMIGPLSTQKAGIQLHPRNNKEFATSAVPQDRRLRNTALRLVISPKRQLPTPKVPDNSDFSKNLRTEIICTFLIGIIPSFLIPVLRGFGSYATEGWANLLFGGIVAGFVTGAIWRPRRPVVKISDAEK